LTQGSWQAEVIEVVQAMGVELEYERLYREYLAQARRGIPMSVREWYEQKLNQIRSELSKMAHARPLGEILIEMGALDEGKLAQALSEQRTEGRQRLLGEILVAHGWVDEATLSQALRVQVFEKVSCDSAYKQN